MGITKQYLRYVAAGTCNLITSSSCNIVFLTLKGIEGRYVATGASEDVIVWDLRLNEKALVLPGEKCEVTRLAVSREKQSLAAGYTDGSLKTFDLDTGEYVSIFMGHKTTITCIKFDTSGHRIATGSKDTDIVVWDVVAECGLQRLYGHKDVVTQIEFHENMLISSSKDSFIKLWDLVSGHCFKTIAGHFNEVWGFCLVRNSEFLISGSTDRDLRVWEIKQKDESKVADIKDINLVGEDDMVDMLVPYEVQKVGTVMRSRTMKVSSMATDSSGEIVAVHAFDYTLELFQFLDDAKSKEKLKKRLRKERNKAKKLEEEEDEMVVDGSTDNSEPILIDIVRRLPVIKVGGKIKSVDLVKGKDNELRIIVSLKNNSLELYSLKVQHQGEPECLRKIISHGHRSEVRALAFSSDNLAIVSASAESLKIWNRPTLSNLRTVDTGYALCVVFVPGDRHALLGTKEGHLQIIDVASGDLLEDIPAHDSELWSICLLPDQTGIVTGGDKTVKFWKLELVLDTESESKAKVLSLLHTRTLKVDETVLCIRVSPNNNLIAVAFIDSTVKIFFMDTFRFFLSLYGHKLPVLCMDISSDSTLIVTGSVDRNVKIWGLDFGDCHKSIFAHDGSTTAVCFVPNSHYFFTCGKDGCIKEWDADNFEKIITIKGHYGEAWCLSVSPNGKYVASCGKDRVIRLFERSSEPLVLEDEQEQEREEEDNNALATGQETSVIGHSDLKLSSKKTVTAEKAAELLLECLQVCAEYRIAQKDAAAQGLAVPVLPTIMIAFNATTPEEYLIQILLRIRSSELEEVLLFLPFTSICELLPQLNPLFSSPFADIVCRVLVFVVRVHHRSILGNHSLIPIIQKLYALASSSLTETKDKIGMNLFGLMFLQREREQKEGVRLFFDATQERKQKQKKKRVRERAAKRAILSVS